jgi:ABC transporter DrrB family efflux protein
VNESLATQTSRQRSPLGQLILARLREFYRRPEAIFWVYGFPLLMVVALGIAFRNKPVQQVKIDVQSGQGSAFIASALKNDPRFEVEIADEAACRLRLRTGKTDLVVVPAGEGQMKCDYLFDDARAESAMARDRANDALQRAAGRRDPLSVGDVRVTEPGSRYIDFLVPGLLGMNLMGGGLWGVGFVIVDMRIRKLLKRFIATPMRRAHFLMGIMLSRQIFMASEMLLLLVFSYFIFDVRIAGNLLTVVFLLFLGAFTFAGIGLLVACRAQTLETVSGLMNMVMLPMWVLSGIFFPSERFPAVMQPVVQFLPLTPLIDALRAVMLEGATLASQWHRVVALALWTAITFTLSLRWFRWT